MSMPQQGPPDPQTPGPVSGSPQPQYDPQAQQPMQPQPGQAPPPQSFPTAGPAQVARPAMLMMGAIGCGALALFFLILAILAFLQVEGHYEFPFLYGGYLLLMAAAAGAAAVFSFLGTDFGRVFAAAVAGAAMWDAAGWWQSLIGPLVSGEGIAVGHFPWIATVTSILGGFVGIGVVVVMSTPALSVYSAEKQKKPTAGPAPMGPPPAAPQAPYQGQTYGAPPPAGQPGQPYGEQPPAQPPHGGQPYPGQNYGEQPPPGPQG